MNNPTIIIPDSCTFGKNVQFNVRGTLQLGECSYIGDNCTINCHDFIAGDYLYIADNVEIGRGGCNNPDSNITIGNNVGIFQNTIINVNSPVIIGDNVGIGADVMIWTHGAWLDVTQGFPADFGPVKIGNNVWLPARSIVLPNVTINDNCVIGINSVVNKDIPSGSLAAGIPCRVIKENAYPNVLSKEELQQLIVPIINYWFNELVPYKGITSVTDISYDSNSEVITLTQTDDMHTLYNVRDKTINGYNNEVSEDFRDYLRRKGIKIYNGKPFKSI